MKYTKIEDLTVGQFQQLHAIHVSSDDDLEKAISSISVLTGLPRWEVEELPLKTFKDLSREIGILFSSPPQAKPKVLKKVRVNGQRYAVILNARKLTLGQYSDLQHFLKQGNMIDNMHKLMACLLVPIRFNPLNILGKYDGANHEKIAEGILSLKFSDVNNTCVFFSKLWNNSIEAIAGYLKKEMMLAMKKNTKSQLSQTDLQTLLDGFIMQSKLPI